MRTWVALAVGLYAAFILQLEGASSAGVCVLILAQPVQGMVLSKSIYRLAGTVVGVVIAVIMTAVFPQDRTMLVASFAVFMGLQTGIGTLLRDFRSYGCILAGYTVAIISIANIDSPGAVFEGALNRVAAILVGIAAIGLTNAFMATAESSRSLTSKLREATKAILELTAMAMDRRIQPDAPTCVDMSARLMPLRSEISFATPENPNGRARAKGARSALLGLFEMLYAAQGVGAGLAHLDKPSALVDRAVEIARKALRLQNPARCNGELEALAMPALKDGSLSMEEAYVLDRLHFMIETLDNLRDGQRSLRLGRPPQRDVALPVHQDYFAVVLNAVRVVTSVAIIAFLAVMSGLSETAQAVLFTAVFVSLGSTTPDPSVMGKAALYGMPPVVLFGSIYSFLIFPNIDGFPLFVISFFPLVVAMCWLVKIGLPGAGLVFGVMTLVLAAPANVQTLDPPTFVSTATMLTCSGAAIFLAFMLVLPVDPAQRRLRLALAVGRQLRQALADERHLAVPRASLMYDRLSQLKTWQGRQTVTLARRKTMKRLVDIGNLASAVRRSWRALDRARPYIDAGTNAQARALLPTLSPEETRALARTYFAASKGQDAHAAFALVHAAAALYGTAAVTSDEMRLLRRVELLRRKT